MPDEKVNEDVHLHIIDTRELVEEQKKLRELKRLEKEKRDVLKKDPKRLKEEKEMLARLRGESEPAPYKKKEVLADVGSSPFFHNVPERDSLPGKVIKGRQDAKTKAKTTSEFSEYMKKQKKLEQKVAKQQKKFEDLQDSMLNDLQQSGSTLGSPDLLSSGLAHLGGKFGVVGQISSAIAIYAVTEFFKSFEQGGANATNLQVTAQDLTVNDITDIIRTKSGLKFVTDDLAVFQGPPGQSSTLDMKYEHVRYTLEELGR